MRSIRHAHSKYHPLTGAPIVPAGYRRNGSPIWPIMGGSGEDGDGDGDGDQGGDGTGDGDGADDGTGDGGDDSPWADPTKAKAEIERLRRENASARTKGNTAKEQAATQAAKEARDALIQEVGKQLGLIEDGAAPTAEQLLAQLTEKDSANQTLTTDHTSLQREHQVLLSAIEAGADYSALLDSRSFLAKVAGLDPADDKFADDVKAAITKAVTDNPKLKATPVVGKGGSEFTGGSGEGAGKAKSLEDAIATRMTT